MFEKLAGKLLWNGLSRYFTDESLAKNNVNKSTQLGIWSGYVSLQDLEVKVDVINTKLRQKCHPIELVHCSIRRIEITIPWAKLSNPISGRRSSGGGDGANSDEAVAVVVLDGVHVLFQASFEFHDEELRAEEVRKRRQALKRSERFVKSGTVDAYDDDDDNKKSYIEQLRNKISSGVVQEIADKLHIHIRDMHVRVEDQQSDPWAFGITLESMHILHDTDEERSSVAGVVSKVAQVNHFAAYWNALEHGEGVPVENAVLHLTCCDRPDLVSRALDKCIARRGSMIASPSRQQYLPTHAYILLPVDGTMHAYLSTSPKDLRLRPAMELVVRVDMVSTHLRDHQCVQMLRLYGQRKNFKFMQKYRRFRPAVSVMQDSKAWWRYAAKVVKYQLDESYMRWSWSRFKQVYAIRLRYMDLYERRIRNSETNAKEISPKSDEEGVHSQSSYDPLSPDEENELTGLEDGLEGDLSISDIVLFRALVNMRVGKMQPDLLYRQRQSENSWLEGDVDDSTIEDSETREEFDRLVQYLESQSTDKPFSESRNESLTALSMEMRLEEVRFQCFAPLHITSDESQRRRLHEKFLEFCTRGTAIGGSLKGDYNRWDVEFSVMDFVASEIRLDKTQHVIADRVGEESATPESNQNENADPGPSPLFLLSYAKRPVSNVDVEKEVRLFLSATEIKLDPDCQWLARAKEFIKIISMVPNVSKFWSELSLAHLNSLALGRLGLVAKAECAAYDHENMDVDVNIHCPVLRVGAGDGGDFIVDFGVLSLKTDKLAGVSCNKLKNVPLLQGEDGDDEEDYDLTKSERSKRSLGDASTEGSFSGRTGSSLSRIVPTNSIRTSMRKFMFSSAASVDSFRPQEFGNGSVTGGSFFLEDEFSPMERQAERKDHEESNLESLFYDRYKLRLQTGKVIFSGETEVFDIAMGIEVRTIIQKSIIPSDHTICKLKAHTVIGNIGLIFNEDIIVRLANASSTWTRLFRTDVTSQSLQWAPRGSTVLYGGFDLKRHTSMDAALSVSVEGDGSGSDVGEEDFFDATEGGDSIAGENSGIWFEDNWIADAESAIDGESSRSSLCDRRGRRRQPSISDVSSASGQSRSQRNHQENGYLSAENLARLEENAGEDDSIAETRIENDDDSFHSVLTSSGQAQLLLDLETDIQQTEGRVIELRDALNDPSLKRGIADESDPREGRRLRKSIKLKIARAEAELKSMQALWRDLKSLLSDKDVGELNGDDKLIAAKNAKSLLEARKLRDENETDGHNLVQGLNRQLFKGTFLFNRIQMTLRLGGVQSVRHDTPGADASFVASQIGLALFHHINETKLYFSLDQATASMTSKDDAPKKTSWVLFSGGSSNTLLPVHLPHLIVQSMEDRFIRGAVRIRRYLTLGTSPQTISTLKVRLVVGDVEISPYSNCLHKLVSCLRHFQGKTKSPDLAPRNDKEEPSLSDGSALSCKRSARSYDLAIRLTSVRVSVTLHNNIVGALTVSETSLRFLQVTSATKNTSQADFGCSNIQILDIVNLEGGRGLEVLGRRDPYSSLVQLRIRSQVAPSSEQGRWVVGIDKRPSQSMKVPSQETMRDVYFSVRINPLSLVASSEVAAKLLHSSQELKDIMLLFKTNLVGAPESARMPEINQVYCCTSIPMRWRVDMSFRRIHVVFPNESGGKGEWNLSDDVGSRMSMAFTTIISSSGSSTIKDCMSVQLGVTDISLIRHADDWPILEPCSVLFEVAINLPGSNGKNTFQPLVVPAAEIDAVMARFGWDSTPSGKTEDDLTKVTFKVSQVKINISAPAVGLLVDVLQSFRALKDSQSSECEGAEDVGSFLPASTRMGSFSLFGLQILLGNVEIQLLHEKEARSISHAKPLISFTMTDVAIDYSQGEQVTASVLIRKSDVFDLSSGRGIRVVGEEPEARPDFPYFVQVKLYMEQHMDGPQTIRFQINWGRIQCLVLPSFVQSILELKEVLKHASSSNQGSHTPIVPKRDLFARLLLHPNDINLILSADAETFECILPSQDAIDYVKNGGKDPIGVVSFRWKASLSVAVGLDCLHSQSMPWLTLNLDGNFTDDDDANLFKDFSNRYLNSEALSNNSGPGLSNAFTIRVCHRISSFQALRTNISQLEINNSTMKYGYNPLPRTCFKISLPAAGEQRITNPIDFILLYRGVGASVANQVEVAQSVYLQANFVDVLLYIQHKSAGGFTDAFRVSIKPILDKLKRKDQRRLLDKGVLQTNQILDHTSPQQIPGLLDLIKRSPFVFTIDIEGFQVTCVPGGASRLNESPIIKFELSNLSSGIAAVPMKQDLRFPPGDATHHNGSPRRYISLSELKNIMVAGWIGCQVTGHYHNRRLVAWEPFIEPWTANARFGFDMVDVFSWSPMLIRETKLLRPRLAQPAGPSSSDNTQMGTPSNSKGDRFRDLGRLLRSPFQSPTSLGTTTLDSDFISQSDFCYLMLASMASTTMASAFYSTRGPQLEVESKLFSVLPSRDSLEWLEGFGMPGASSGDHQDVNGLSSLLFLLSDARPLNINLTGALIENIAGYMESAKRTGANKVVPHLIRNETGMTVRFQEVLDADRARRGEQATRIRLGNGSGVPLTLKRSLSQTCDPHRAYIHLELGSFEDTVGRVNHDNFEIPKGQRSSSFFFKAAAKIPVDAVGVHRYALDQNLDTRQGAKNGPSNSRALGWIIVRVELRESVKVVSIESPFLLKSAADADLICEIRSHNGISLLWRCLVPRRVGNDRSKKQGGVVSVPADIVPFLHDGPYRLSVAAISRRHSITYEAEAISIRSAAVEIETPAPFSPDSFGKGLVGEQEIVLRSLLPPASNEDSGIIDSNEKVHLSACAVRIGSVSFSRVDAAIEIPEQRMIFFRSPLVIKNFLALPVALQIRVKGETGLNTVKGGRRETPLARGTTLLGDWKDLGVLDCGESANWTGSLSSGSVQVRARFVGTDGDNSRRFPDWSSAVDIPARERSSGSRVRQEIGRTFAKMKVLDADGVSLSLSVAVETGNGDMKDGDEDSIWQFCYTFASAARLVSIFVPYWIVDGTQQDLEFFAGSPVAGQLDSSRQNDRILAQGIRFGNTLGLAELMDNSTTFLHSAFPTEFNVLMIGDENSSRLTVRRRRNRMARNGMHRNASPWSDPIPLQKDQKKRHDITVLESHEISFGESVSEDDSQIIGRLVLRSNMVSAIERFGGNLGTKIVHIVNRYAISNETGRDIEIITSGGSTSSVTVRAAAAPQPFHFDDSRPIRFRFKEFGWTWSGSFRIRLNRREVTMRLRHKMKGHTVIVTLEVHASKTAATSLLIFRQTTRPPFRLENHTMYPMRFGQSITRLTVNSSEESNVDSLLLQYQNVDFAWDEPEQRGRTLVVKSSESADTLEDLTLGRFKLDRIAPGTEVELDNELFSAEVVADGPTRVLRITDSGMPRISSFRQDDFDHFQQAPKEVVKSLTMVASVRLSHGVGISLVDFSPKELVYIRLEDLQLQRRVGVKTEDVNISIGTIKVNNQLWVTPYPVLVRMGRQNDAARTRKSRRHDAVSVSWRSSLNTHGGYGNLTLLDKIDVTSEPAHVNVDGELASLILRMMRHISGIGSSSRDPETSSCHSRDEDLKALLAITDGGEFSEGGSLPTTKDASLTLGDKTMDFISTAAVAAKLQSKHPYQQPTTPRHGFNPGRYSTRRKKTQPLTKVQHKFYVERLRISTTRADISWSGPLPGMVSSLLFRALTFERLPVRLRPFSSTHAYGNLEDHLQTLRSHYVSFWRVVDLLMGLSSNPTFLFRAALHTFRESCVSILGSWSVMLGKFSTQLPLLLPKDSEFQPIFDDDIARDVSTQGSQLMQRTMAPFFNGTSFFLLKLSSAINWFSSRLEYDPKSSSSPQARGQVRSRNPRLFAHLDGKDLLVEYVEGENAGKALLSRVRMGIHLGEGYFFHAEEAHQLKPLAKSRTDLDPAQLILMITSERILLLTGKLDANFCSVQWEAFFVNVAHVEVVPAKELQTFAYDEVVIWYLSDPKFSQGNTNIDVSASYAMALAAGLEFLRCKRIFVPRQLGRQVLAKVRSVDHRL